MHVVYKVVVAFAGGIVFRSFFDVGIWFAVFSAGAAGALLFVYMQSKARFACMLALVCIAFGAGVLRADVAHILNAPRLPDIAGTETVVIGTVADEPDERADHTKLTLETEVFQVRAGIRDVSDRILLITEHYPAFHYGDRVRASGKLVKPDNAFQENTPGAPFDYVGFLAKDGIHYQMFYPELERIQKGNGNSLYALLFAVKERMLAGVSRLLPEPHAALAGGITFGAKRALGESLLDMFRTTGLIHIVVLSGYNISIVVYAIRGLLSRAPFFLGVGISAIAIIAFVIMTGANATAVRAGAMAVLALAAHAAGRPYAVLNALFAAAGAMLFWNPFILLSDPSFQLSFMATFGLIVLAPRVEQFFFWIPERALGLRSIAAATIATQAFVLPLILYMTGTLSLIAPVANIAVLPVVPIAMLFAGAAGTAALVSLPGAALFGTLAYLPLAYIVHANALFASLPFAAVTIASFPLSAVFFVYAGILAGSFFRKVP